MIYLASKSPRRRELLNQIGLRHEIIEVDIDESWDPSEPARVHVPQLALSKARAAKAELGDKAQYPILAADTEVVLDDNVLGKPFDSETAVAMLMRLSGRTHHVYSAVALIAEGQEHSLLNISQVSFRPLSESECRAYVATGEPPDKAGAYAIQGLAAAFISRLEGSYSGVMGLPLYETVQLLRRINMDVLMDGPRMNANIHK
jgi:septum formation protein